MTTPIEALRQAAQAVVDRWDTPGWKDAPHTGNYINALRAALAAAEQAEPRVTQGMRDIVAQMNIRDDSIAAIAKEYGMEAEKAEPLTNIVVDAIEGYKAGLVGAPMGSVSEAFDCGWLSGQAEKAAPKATP